jgi:hypothetical protein
MNEGRKNYVSNIAVALIIAAGLIASAFIASNTILKVKSQNHTITVTGSAKQQITSDLVVWTGYFSAQSPSLQEAYAQLEAAKEKVESYLNQKGVPRSETVFSSINTNTYYIMNYNGMYTHDVDTYELSQNVTITSGEIDRITEISRSSTDLINDGVQFQSYAPQYQYTKIADLKVAMLAGATQDAANRARMIAENAGGTLGGLTYADMGVIQITPSIPTTCPTTE